MPESPLEFFDVIGINPDGSRVVVETGFPRHDAEQCRQFLLAAGGFSAVELERIDDFDPPRPLYRLIGVSASGERIVICDGVTFETIESERRKLLESKSFARLVTEPANSMARNPIDPRD